LSLNFLNKKGLNFSKFRYADRLDWILLAVGLAMAVVSGVASPLVSVIFRGITDVLMEGQSRVENGTLDNDAFSGPRKFWPSNPNLFTNFASGFSSFYFETFLCLLLV
jgi:hypothetical protein